ncbi:hypothetical protein QCA50_013682 [Cerrena zonata]|uniref:Uncharacterized protein n=1 Tax=Cerrena zonata TaxID=2478898 RepID=A0AAW0FP03_9APHY
MDNALDNCRTRFQTQLDPLPLIQQSIKDCFMEQQLLTQKKVISATCMLKQTTNCLASLQSQIAANELSSATSRSNAPCSLSRQQHSSVVHPPSTAPAASPTFPPSHAPPPSPVPPPSPAPPPSLC